MFRSLQAVVLVLSLMSASCSLPVEDPAVAASDDDEAESAGGAEPSGVGGAGGSSPAEPPATPLVDTGTLSVAVSITAGNHDPAKIGQADMARVGLMVTVTERESGQPVNDAEVHGGLPGALVSLPYDVYSLSTYGGEIVGYEPVFELSIVRGVDRIEGLLVAGPSYPTAIVAIEPTSGSITWAPATELGVTVRVCATTTNVPRPYTLFSQLCVDTVDSGGLALDAEQRNQMFPFPGTYRVAIERFLHQPTSTGDERSVTVVAATELTL